MRGSAIRPALVELVLLAGLLACDPGEGAAEPRDRGAGPAPALLGGWAPRALPPTTRAASPGTVQVGGRSVRRAIGLASSGRPALSPDGAWAVWTGEQGVVVREVRSGLTRQVPLPAGLMPASAAFFGPGAAELGVAMQRADPSGAEEHLVVVYETAGLGLVHALSTHALYESCSMLLGTDRELLCIVDRATETDPSYILALAPSTHRARTIRLVTTSGIPVAVASQDGSHLYHAARRGAPPGREVIVDLDLAGGRERTFRAPTTDDGDRVTGLGIDPSGTHLAIGTFSGRLSLHALPSGRLVRSAEHVPSERQDVGASDDLTLWDHRDALAEHRAVGGTRKHFNPCGHFQALQDTGTELVVASYVALCVFDRRTLALDGARSTVVEGQRAEWRGDEVVTLSSALSPNDVPVPRVVRRSVTTGALVAVEHTVPALISALGIRASLPRALQGAPAAGTPYVHELSGARAIVTMRGELGTVLYDLSAERVIAPMDPPAVFLAGGAEILQAAFAPRNAARNKGLAIRASRDGASVRTIRPLTDFPSGVRVVPGERQALVTYERRAELVSLADGATTVLHQGLVHDAAIRSDGRELALSVFCSDDEPCVTRVLRMSLPSGDVVATLDCTERVRPAYAPSNDAIALVHSAGMTIQPLATGWSAPRPRPRGGEHR